MCLPTGVTTMPASPLVVALPCCAVLPCWPLHQFDYLGETTEGNLHLVQRLQRDGMVNVFGLNSLQDIVTVPVADLAAATQVWPGRHAVGHRQAGLFCSRQCSSSWQGAH